MWVLSFLQEHCLQASFSLAAPRHEPRALSERHSKVLVIPWCGTGAKDPKLPICQGSIAMKSKSVLQFRYDSAYIYIYQMFYLAINLKK